MTFSICRLWRRRPLKWNTAHVSVTGGHFENNSGPVFLTPSKQRVSDFPKAWPAINPLFQFSAETQSSMLRDSISLVFFWCHYFTVLFTLTLVWPLAVVSLGTEHRRVERNRSPVYEKEENRKKKHRERKIGLEHMVDLSHLTSCYVFFRILPGILTPSSHMPPPNKQRKEEKWIMHFCW